MKDAPEKDDISYHSRDALAKLARDIIELTLQEHRHIHRELDNVSKLISDASKTLSRSFDNITTIISSLISDTKDVAPELREDLKTNKQEIVTALQFDDIVQQLTRHSQRRTSHMLVLYEKLVSSLGRMNTRGAHIDDLCSTIEELRRDTEILRKELEKDSPVKQNSLRTGKTELF